MSLPSRLNTYLASNQELRQLAGQAANLMALQKHYRIIVPPALGNSSQVVQLRQHTAVIAATNGAVAAKLRQMTSELISLFQARGCEITGIRITVQVTSPRPHALPARRQLGMAARKALDSLGSTLPESSLKTALQRLSRKR